MLREIAITDQLDWLSNVPYTPGQPHWLPQGFEAYLKILFPIGIDHRILLEKYSFKSSSIAEMNAHAAFYRKYDLGGPTTTDDQLTHITYHALAQNWGIPYTSSFTPADISTHFGGWPPNLRESKQLNEVFVQLLIQAIGPAAPAYFSGSVDNGDYHWVNGFPTDWLEIGTVADLAHLYQRDRQFPGYIFDPSHAWCLIHMEFAEYVVLGCPLSLAATVATHSMLETIRLT